MSLDTAGYPKCPECGHWIPPEDPTHDQREEFLADESTQSCGQCSLLWSVLILKIFEEVARETA
jgi:hypothetical protein